MVWPQEGEAAFKYVSSSQRSPAYLRSPRVTRSRHRGESKFDFPWKRVRVGLRSSSGVYANTRRDA
eukprot:1137225-Pelagomonas_calceolata.AAC.3